MTNCELLWLISPLKPVENGNCLTQSNSESVQLTFQLTARDRFRSSGGLLSIERLLRLVIFMAAHSNGQDIIFCSYGYFIIIIIIFIRRKHTI